MIKYILAGLLFGAAHGMTVPVKAEENLTKGYHTYDSRVYVSEGVYKGCSRN